MTIKNEKKPNRTLNFIPLFFASIAIPIGVAISLDDRNAEYGENKINEIKSNEFDYSKLGANN